MNSRPWFDTYFAADYRRTHRAMIQSAPTEEVEFAQKVLSLKSDARLLDVPCGHGRHAIEFADLGYRVTGIDLNSEFLEAAREAASGRGIADRVCFLRRDMRDLDFEAEFDAATNLFNSFGYFGDGEDLEVLDGIARALKPGGRFLLEQGNRDYYVKNAHPTSWEELPDAYVLYRFAFHAQTGVAHTQQVILEKDNHEARTYDIAIRLYSFPELQAMMNAVGLWPYQVFGDWEGSSFTSDSPQMIVVAIKSDHGAAS